MQGNNPVKENIDERILRLLGLLDVFDLDYDTYKTLLKEQLVLVTSSRKKIPPEEFELLKNEFKRVRNKTGRFIPKKKKPITANNVSNLNSFSKKILKGTAVAKESSPKNQNKSSVSSTGILGLIKTISSLVENIHEAVQYQTNLFRNQYERDRIERERLRRGEEEDRLESKKDGFLKKAKKILAPFESIFDRILRFLVFTILGRAFKLFMDWASNPENRKKLETIGRFLKDWWPALLGAWFFFANPLGRFIRTIVGTVTKLTFKLAKFAIPKLLTFIKLNPKAALALAAVGGGSYLATKITGQQEAAPVQAETKARAQRGETLDIRGLDTPIDRSPSVGDMGPTTPFGLLQGVNTGGIIRRISSGGNIFSGLVDRDTGQTVSGAGPDTQFLPIEDGGGAVLQRGEVVLQKGARERMMQQVGVDPLAFNIGTNANKPRKINADTLVGLNNGGEIGIAAHHLKQDEALSSLSPGTNSFTRPGSPNWSRINSNTPIYSYLDSVRQPTIGWGSTFYDSILNGRKPVRMGDKITKLRADTILQDNIKNLSTEYSTKIPHWNKMSNSQRAGLLVLGYNAPYGPIGAYPNLTNALKEGDMSKASQHLQRGGPNAERIALERKLLLDGPTNLRNLVGPKIVGEGRVGTGNPIIDFARNIRGMIQNRRGGGKVKSTDGTYNPHSSTDNRLFDISGTNGIAGLQVGEGILTRLAMERGGEEILNALNAALDPNSDAAKSGARTALNALIKPKSPNIGPPMRGRGGIASITLPPINQSSGNVPLSSNSGTQVPSFSAVSPIAMSVRINNADTYGITG